MPAARKRSTSAPKKSPSKQAPSCNPTEKYSELFKSIDLDGNGTIEPTELMLALPDLKLTPHRIDVMFKEADLDGNGRIDLDEFAKVMERSRDSLDIWGMASKSLWGKFWHNLKDQTMKTAEIVDTAIQPLHQLSRRHSSVVIVQAATYYEPVITLRVVAHIFGPLLLGVSVIAAFSACMLPAIAFEAGAQRQRNIWETGGSDITKFLTVLGSFAGLMTAFVLCILPATRGQTAGHYFFGLQMISSTSGKPCGFGMIFLKYVLTIILSICTFGFYELIDGIVLLAQGKTITDSLLGVQVVCR